MKNIQKIRKLNLKSLAICILLLLVLHVSINQITALLPDNNRNSVITLNYWTQGITVSDANITALSSSGIGTSDNPYIIENLNINTTDSNAVEFDGVSPTTHWVLRDSHIIGNTYGIYISDNTQGKANIINCTVEGDLTIGTPNARYITVDNCTLISSQGSTFRRGITFTNNIVQTTSSYSVHLARFQNQDNLIANNVFYGNNSEVRFQFIYNSSILNNVFVSAGIQITDNDVVETINNTIEGNTIDGKPYGFFYNIVGETINGDIYGQIYLFNSNNTRIADHSLFGSQYGIQIHKCRDITVDNVAISGKSGIEMRSSYDIVIENSIFEGFSKGFDISMVDDLTIVNCDFRNFAYGIGCFAVDGLYVYNNTLFDIEDNGIDLEDSYNIEIKFNIIVVKVEIPGNELGFVSWACENITMYYNVFINLGNNTESPVSSNGSTNIMLYDEVLEIGNHYSDWNGTGNYTEGGMDAIVDIYPILDFDQDLINEFEEVIIHFTNPFSSDSDEDGLTDYEELFQYYTDPLSEDSDEDGMDDLWEVVYGTNPNSNDANGDLDSDDLTNLEEYNLGTKPNNNDTDSDGMTDGWEYLYNLDLFANDSAEDPDNDGLSNIEEFVIGTMPNNNDTDGDTYLDGEEVLAGTDPLNASSFPTSPSQVGLILGLTFGFATIVGAVIFLNTSKGKPILKKLLALFKK